MMLRQIFRLFTYSAAFDALTVASLAIGLVIASQLGWPDIQSERPLQELQSGLLIWRLVLYSLLAWFWFDLLRRTYPVEAPRLIRLGSVTLLLIVAIEWAKS